MTVAVQNEVVQNGIAIVRTPTGIGVGCIDAEKLCHWGLTLLDATRYTTSFPQPKTWRIEVWYFGRLIKEELLDPNEPWRDYYKDHDMLACGIKVFDNYHLLAELPAPPYADPMPFMVPRLQQVHITESYVSVPPALTITDKVGAVWTLGFAVAPPEQRPYGEFAFEVLRNGFGTGVIASRIEMRNGKVRVFTKNGWKVWGQREFI